MEVFKRHGLTADRVAIVMALRDGDMHDTLELAYCSGLGEDQVTELLQTSRKLVGPVRCLKCGVRLTEVPCRACRLAGVYPRYQPAAERESTSREGEYEYPRAPAKD